MISMPADRLETEPPKGSACERCSLQFLRCLIVAFLVAPLGRAIDSDRPDGLVMKCIVEEVWQWRR